VGLPSAEVLGRPGLCRERQRLASTPRLDRPCRVSSYEFESGDARIFDTTQRQNHSQAKMCVSRAMFYQATAFNQNIASWSTARVSNMNHDMKSVS
jgi:hypothetical protein